MPGVHVCVHMVRIRGVHASASDMRLPVTVIIPGCHGSAVPGACPGTGGIRARGGTGLCTSPRCTFGTPCGPWVLWAVGARLTPSVALSRAIHRSWRGTVRDDIPVAVTVFVRARHREAAGAARGAGVVEARRRGPQLVGVSCCMSTSRVAPAPSNHSPLAKWYVGLTTS